VINDQSTRKTRLISNSVYSIFGWGIPLCLTFFATPIIIKGLGNENFGIYSIGLGFLNGVFSTGIGKVSAKYIPEFRSAGSNAEIGQTISATLIITLVVGLIQAGTLALIAPWIVSDVLLIDAGSQPVVIKVLYLTSIGGLAVMIGQVFYFILHGTHRFEIYAWVTILNGLLLNTGNIFLVLSGFGVVSLMAWNSFAVATVGSIAFWQARRQLPESRFTVSISRRFFSIVLAYAGSIITYQALTSIMIVFERTWIVRNFGTEALAFYSIAILLAWYMHGFLASSMQAVFPAVNELIHDRQRLTILYQRATKYVFVGTVFIATQYVINGKIFLGLWINIEFADRSYPLLVILSFAIGLNAVGLVAWLLAEAFRAPGINAFSSALWLAGTIPGMIAGISLGLEGIAYARLGGILLTLPLISYVERRFLGKIFAGYWLTLVLRTLIPIALTVITVILAFSAFEANWVVLLVRIFGGTVAFAAGLLVTGLLTRGEITLLLESVRSLIRFVPFSNRES
jgi:O-antigen/teichoic acid export membrane protein